MSDNTQINDEDLSRLSKLVRQKITTKDEFQISLQASQTLEIMSHTAKASIETLEVMSHRAKTTIAMCEHIMQIARHRREDYVLQFSKCQ